MDKSKFAWPRWDWHRLPKDFEALVRPRMNFTAVLVHGWGCFLGMSSETVSHGADFCIDILRRALQMVYERIKGKQGQEGDDDDEDFILKFPRHLVIQSDNTVSQAKNQFFFLFLAWLVSASSLFDKSSTRHMVNTPGACCGKQTFPKR